MYAQFSQHQLPPPPPHRRLPKRIHGAPKEPHHRLPVITPEDTILRFHRLLSDGALTLNHHTFRSLFKACRVLSALEEGRQFHAQAVKRGLLGDAFVRRSLVRMYAKCLACHDAHKVFAECNVPDVVSQNDLVVGFINNGDLETARKIFDGMAERNVVSWSVMVDGYARHGLMEIAQDLFDVMPERNQFSWNSLISGYLRCGSVEVARGIFDQMRPEWSVITWTAMISGYTQNGRFKEALDLFLEMQIAGVAPNKITLVSILPAVAQLGALNQGRWIHAYMDKMGSPENWQVPVHNSFVDQKNKEVCLEGRNIQSEPKPYKPQNFLGFGGIVTSPGLGGGGGSGLIPGGFGFGTPIFGSVPIIGSVPAAPGAGLRARRGGKP
ncbi:putative pentatricopeptide repeat-containing protein, chloroplastic [Cocos nucifera]|uniref:Putative pentatricopeptide repeat-containing protein, chloroplastic n=1 Tax=Cocos nucifera TaxID=13894 RepID=A0A8K0HT31_COCNU|nr:putative pentatricopeptide repeat-containing protein, chloroplastic [Cocos nucifera]